MTLLLSSLLQGVCVCVCVCVVVVVVVACIGLYLCCCCLLLFVVVVCVGGCMHWIVSLVCVCVRKVGKESR